MKIDFTTIKVPVSFDGKEQVYNAAEAVGNLMMYNGSVLLDIGFEELAKEIYYSKGAVEIPARYAPAIVKVIKEASFAASLKRELTKQLSNEVHQS